MRIVIYSASKVKSGVICWYSGRRWVCCGHWLAHWVLVVSRPRVAARLLLCSLGAFMRANAMLFLPG